MNRGVDAKGRLAHTHNQASRLRRDAGGWLARRAAGQECHMVDYNELVQAIQSLNADDAFRPRLDAQQWRTFGQYLTRHEVRMGDVVIRQGEHDRTLYLLAKGTMQVYVTGAPPGTSRMALLRPGALIGEPGLFADGPRLANVEAMTPCVIYALRLPRFEEMANRVPAMALEIARAAGAVMAVRMRANLARQTPMQ
jgi:CRP/FNR family cyclic AMP-dependent transcriptional regulator